MSGEGRKTIHKETGNGGWPNGLTVDYLERRILWIDARSERGRTWTFVWLRFFFFTPGNVTWRVLSIDLTPSTQPNMTVLDSLRYWGVTSICPIPLRSPCTEERFTGRTGGPTRWPRQTNGPGVTSLSFRGPTLNLLTCRSIIHPDSHRVRDRNTCEYCGIVNKNVGSKSSLKQFWQHLQSIQDLYFIHMSALLGCFVSCCSGAV